MVDREKVEQYARAFDQFADTSAKDDTYRSYVSHTTCRTTATLLREQQKEIERLLGQLGGAALSEEWNTRDRNNLLCALQQIGEGDYESGEQIHIANDALHAYTTSWGLPPGIDFCAALQENDDG